MVALRMTLAYAAWALAVLGALVLSGAAVLVALRTDPHSAWGWWLEAADLITFGWFARRPDSVVGGGDVVDTVLRWGSAATAFLLVGAALQWVFRPAR